MMRLLFIGGPASGKGTQALKLMQKLKIPQISTGDLLRKAIQQNNPNTQQVKKMMDAGQLVPDKIVVDLVNERIKQPDCARGFLLDGFPRNMDQLKLLQQRPVPNFFSEISKNNPAILPIDHVIELSLDDNAAISRIQGRQIHLASGRTYHEKFNPPKVPGKDDITGEKLITRTDDNVDTIKNRLSIYHRLTQPLINFFQRFSSTYQSAPKFHRIDAAQSPDTVFQNIMKAIDKNNLGQEQTPIFKPM